MNEPRMVQTDDPVETLRKYQEAGFRAKAVRTKRVWYVCYGNTNTELNESIRACLDT